jgi:hypothetical protein
VATTDAPADDDAATGNARRNYTGINSSDVSIAVHDANGTYELWRIPSATTTAANIEYGIAAVWIWKWE